MTVWRGARSPQSVLQYVNEFAGHANVIELVKFAQIMILAIGMIGKRVQWNVLTLMSRDLRNRRGLREYEGLQARRGNCGFPLAELNPFRSFEPALLYFP